MTQIDDDLFRRRRQLGGKCRGKILHRHVLVVRAFVVLDEQRSRLRQRCAVCAVLQERIRQRKDGRCVVSVFGQALKGDRLLLPVHRVFKRNLDGVHRIRRADFPEQSEHAQIPRSLRPAASFRFEADVGRECRFDFFNRHISDGGNRPPQIGLRAFLPLNNHIFFLDRHHDIRRANIVPCPVEQLRMLILQRRNPSAQRKARFSLFLQLVPILRQRFRLRIKRLFRDIRVRRRMIGSKRIRHNLRYACLRLRAARQQKHRRHQQPSKSIRLFHVVPS